MSSAVIGGTASTRMRVCPLTEYVRSSVRVSSQTHVANSSAARGELGNYNDKNKEWAVGAESARLKPTSSIHRQRRVNELEMAHTHKVCYLTREGERVFKCEVANDCLPLFQGMLRRSARLHNLYQSGVQYL